jgi:hypothetical protein
MPVLKAAKGLHTFNNELNEVEGALDVADNIVIDADDTIQSRRGFGEFGVPFGTSSDTLKQVITYKDRILRHFNSTLQFDSSGQGAFSDFSGSFSEVNSGVRIKYQETNGNLYFTTSDGIKKISAKTASDFSTASGYISNSGIAKGLDVEAQLAFSSGGFLPPQSKCAYRVVWGIRDNNNNLLLGSPSSRSILTNNSVEVLTPEQFQLTHTSNNASDYDATVDDRFVLFSSTTAEYFLWYSTSTNPDAPKAPETVGRIGVEANIEGLSSSADIAVAAASAIATSTSNQFTAEVQGSTVLVTSEEDGENLFDAASSAALTSVTTTVTDQGTIAEGQSANANLTITVPSQIDNTSYFYQVYRTAPITGTAGTSIDDLDPGDEMNLAFESNITSAEITAGEVTLTDITTETFRASGAFLYTNPNTGEGILQANDRPPIAKDIELFRNSLFFANTKTAHRLTLNLLSISAFTSGLSDLIIGNGTTTTEYTFVGDQEISEVTTDSFANTTDTGYILLNSARNERKYYLWFDKGSTIDPNVSGRVGIKTEIEAGDTANDVATKLASALNGVADFTASETGSVVEITNVKNGNTDDLSIGSALGGLWAVSVTNQGDGEDSSINEVLLSNQASAALSIDETARSLVKVINKDSASPVNAFYLSGEDDLPGIILLESKSLTDAEFFVATSDTNITSQFNPELPLTETITAISVDDPTEITSAGHGLLTGDEVYIYNTDSTPALSGKYTVTVVDSNTFSVPVAVLSAGTTGIWFKANVVSDNEESPNRLFYSKLRQPEAVPITNFIDIGPKDKAILRILALRDNLFVLKEDGVYIVTGTTAPDFGARLLDGSTEITAGDTAAVLNNRIYALSSQGVVTISEGGVGIISRPIEDKILEVANSRYNYRTTSFGVAYESDRSYIIWLPSSTLDNVATQAYRYNTFTRTWTRWTYGATCGIVNPGNDILYTGPIDRNYVDQERKNNDRTDYADRDFELSIAADNVTTNKVILSSVADLAEGDVLVQTQYLTVPFYNRFLKRLDLDNGLDDNDYFSTLSAQAGDDLTDKMDALNAKLVADDASGTVSVRTYSVDFETLQSEVNLLVAELNDPLCDTFIKDYKQSENTIPYEAIITSVNREDSFVLLNAELPYIEGPIQAFKGISTKIQWAPQHFGASDLLKQVREGTFLLDQNNFYSGSVAYSSDLSANFQEIEFIARGVGFWGGNVWGEGTWGGLGNEVPVRTLIPRDKQRCRHIKVVFEHINAREIYKILGISLEPRPISKRAYR